MIQDDADLQELAGAMLDGAPIDWGSVQSNAADASRRGAVKALKIIASIAEVHTSVALSSERSASGSDTDQGAPQSDAGSDRNSEPVATWSGLRLLEKVGEGAYGEVYRAWDSRLDRQVALKLLRRDDSAHASSVSSLAIEEGRMLAQVRHPNVVTVHGADRSAGRVGLWMEFVRGRTLEQILREQGPFGAQETTQIGLDLCRALSAVHRAGLLHRDIKAHNVMREEGGRIVLMDFGTGFDRPDDSGDSAGGLVGTPIYMPPETLGGEEASVQSDLYGIGVLLYHLVTASYPVQGRTVQDVRDAHARGKRTLLRDARPDLPDGFVHIVERALAPSPEARFESAGAMEAALVSAGEPRPPTASLVTDARSARTIRRWRTAAIAAGLLVLATMGSLWLTPGTAEPPVIAVMPFENRSAEPDSDYFVDGLTEEVIRNLSVIDGLTVRSSTSSFAFKNKPRNVREMGRQLNANLVLEASVLRAGMQLRIIAQLVRVADDVPVWSKRFDSELKDVFAIQDELSRSIVNALRLSGVGGQRRYETNVEAYELYLKGLALVGRRGNPSLAQAAHVFTQAVIKDSGFAPAHAGLANAYAFWSMPSGGIDFATAHPIMRAAAIKAYDLDPLLPDALAAMGWLYSREFDWANAQRAFQRAIDLGPGLTRTYIGYSHSTLRPLGKNDAVLRLLSVARQNDPLSLDVQREIGEVQIDAGRYDQAIDTFGRVRAVDPDFPLVRNHLARALIFAGRPAEALRILEKLDGRDLGGLGRPTTRPRRLALAYVMLGRRAEAEEMAVESSGDVFVVSALGYRDRTFDALERMAVVEPHRVGLVLNYPELAFLRGDPRLIAFRKRFNLPTQ